MMKTILILMTLLIGWNVCAEDIEVPEEELARETTLPVFSKRRIVLNRNVITTEKFEFGLGGGMQMNEPFYNQWLYGLQGTYNFTDVSAVNANFTMFGKGLSSYGEQLKQGKPTVSTAKFNAFDASKAPHPSWSAFVNYEYIAYYGKISFTKQGVMNLNTFALVGLGYINMDTASTVGADVGVGQNFFFTQHMAIRWDLKYLIFQGPDPTSVQDMGPTAKPKASDFSNRLYYNSQLDLALVFVL